MMPDNIRSLRSHHLLRIILTRLDRNFDTLPARISVAHTTLLKHSRDESLHLLLQGIISHLHVQQPSEFPVSTLETVQEFIPYKFWGDLTVWDAWCAVALLHNARL